MEFGALSVKISTHREAEPAVSRGPQRWRHEQTEGRMQKQGYLKKWGLLTEPQK